MSHLGVLSSEGVGHNTPGMDGARVSVHCLTRKSEIKEMTSVFRKLTVIDVKNHSFTKARTIEKVFV